MKFSKLKLQFLLLLLFSSRLFADTFTDAIQDLAVRTACVGMYNMSETSTGGPDPADNYTPQMMSQRLAQESGSMTRTTTFYGVCFDYAQFAYEYVIRYKNWYNQQGMYEQQVWMVAVHDNSNQITLEYPGSKSNYTTYHNGVYLKVPSLGGNRSVKAHKMPWGNRPTRHEWIWIQRADGVQFWVDPTWTDYFGYVVYGYVKNGEEILCRPDKKYCINYPSYLNNLPLPPAMGQKAPPSSTANSTNPEETIINAGRDYIDIITGKKIHATDDDLSYIISAGFHTPLENPFKSSIMGFSVASEGVPVTADTWHSLLYIIQLDYYKLDERSALLFDVDLGYQLGFNYFELGIYGGGGIGWSDDGLLPFTFQNPGFEWKWTVGTRLMLKKISLRGEISYLNKTGYMLGMYVGIPIANKNSRY